MSMAEFCEKISKFTEAEFRDFAFKDTPWPKSLEEMNQVIMALAKRPHDYGTAVYAMTFAGLMAFNYMSNVVGSSGFQAGCASGDLFRRLRWYRHGYRIFDYNNLLYPHLGNDFPSKPEMIWKNRKWLAEEAKKKLEESDHAAPTVKAHWEYLVMLGEMYPEEEE